MKHSADAFCNCGCFGMSGLARCRVLEDESTEQVCGHTWLTLDDTSQTYGKIPQPMCKLRPREDAERLMGLERKMAEQDAADLQNVRFGNGMSFDTSSMASKNLVFACVCMFLPPIY